MGLLFELLGDAIIDGWFFLMEWIIPEKYFSKTFQIVLKIFVGVFSALLFIIMVCGVFAIISSDPYTHQIGKYMLFIPLGVSAVQIVLGIVVRITTKKKH